MTSQRRFRISDAMALTVAIALAATVLANSQIREFLLAPSFFISALTSSLTLVLAAVVVADTIPLREAARGVGKLSLLLMSSANLVHAMSRLPFHLRQTRFTQPFSVVYDVFIGFHALGLAGLIALCSLMTICMLRPERTRVDWIEIAGRILAFLAFLSFLT